MPSLEELFLTGDPPPPRPPSVPGNYAEEHDRGRLSDIERPGEESLHRLAVRIGKEEREDG